MYPFLKFTLLSMADTDHEDVLGVTSHPHSSITLGYFDEKE